MNNKTKGYLYGAVAAATYGMNPLFALPLYADGMNADSVLFFRYLLALAILGGMIKWRGRDFRVRKREVFPLAAIGVLMACSSLTLFLSYNYMAAGIASTMLFVYPILVALIMAICFREKVTILTAACIALACWESPCCTRATAARRWIPSGSLWSWLRLCLMPFTWSG